MLNERKRLWYALSLQTGLCRQVVYQIIFPPTPVVPSGVLPHPAPTLACTGRNNPPESLCPISSPLYVHSMSGWGNSLVHDIHTGKLVHSDDVSSFPQINGGQHLILMKSHWLCAGPAYIFYLPSAFHISTWKQKGSFVCFGSEGGEVLILDISPATSTLGRM